MTPDALRTTLAALGWTQGDLSRRLAVHRSTVNEWCQGKRPIPGYVLEYMRVVRGPILPR